MVTKSSPWKRLKEPPTGMTSLGKDHAVQFVTAFNTNVQPWA